MNLQQYIIEQLNREVVNEGGAAGHMLYPHNYLELTFGDLKQIVSELLSGKITDVTEKVDGMNIQATKNKAGEVVFARNKGDLNSERGGMLRADMINKWSDKPHVLKTFTRAASTIEKVFADLPVSFFNGDNERRYVNCECVIEGTTNIMPYVSNQVDFHDIWIYRYNGKEWVKDGVTKEGLDKIEKACKNTDARLTPRVIIDTTDQANEMCKRYVDQLSKIGKDELMIRDYLRDRFEEILLEDYWFFTEDYPTIGMLFERFFMDDKSYSIRLLKKQYDEYSDQIDTLIKKDYKRIVDECVKPLDNFFLQFGNDVIKLCKGVINQGREDQVVKELITQLQDTVNSIKKEGSVEQQEKLNKQLSKLQLVGDRFNAAEGIVFTWNGKTMKLTGGFGPLNQILGSIKFK